jgi:hypothetical protein
LAEYLELNLTPYEALDLGQSALSNSLAAYAVFLSLAFAYLLAAYQVGAALSHLQVRLLTALFVVTIVLLIWSMSAYTSWAYVFSIIARGGKIERSVLATQSWVPVLLAVINALTVAACCSFMWDVRRVRTNKR